MAYVGDLTTRQRSWVDSEVEDRWVAIPASKCTCGAFIRGHRGHSPNCSFVLAEDIQYDDLIEQLREEGIPSDDELYEIQCESAEAAWFEDAAYGYPE